MSRGIFSYFGLFLSQPRLGLAFKGAIGCRGCWGAWPARGVRRPGLTCKMRKSELELILRSATQNCRFVLDCSRLRAKDARSGSDPRSDARQTVVLYGRSWVRAGGRAVIPAAGRHFPAALRPLPRPVSLRVGDALVSLTLTGGHPSPSSDQG